MKCDEQSVTQKGKPFENSKRPHSTNEYKIQRVIYLQTKDCAQGKRVTKMIITYFIKSYLLHSILPLMMAKSLAEH